VRPPGAVGPIGGTVMGLNFHSQQSHLTQTQLRNVTWPELKYISIRKMRIVDLGSVNMRAYNFFVSEPKFTNFLLSYRVILSAKIWSFEIVDLVGKH